MAPKEKEIGRIQEESPPETTAISPNGDLVLDIHNEARNQVFSYRVSAEQVKQASPYFVRLLDPSKFGEGQKVAETLKELRTTYADIGDAPAKELPRVSIVDIGRISKVNTIQNLVADFLRILHGIEISTPVPPLPNLANLAVVADRFDALTHFSAYAQRKKVFTTIDARGKGKLASLTEERLRQKLLVGLLLDHSSWISTASKRLIIGGSVQWKSDAEEDEELASWWDMPHGLEDEMLSRREFVLDTLQSVLSHFLEIYSSGERQCKLGYDSSTQCDSFQLGEMVRFFTRTNMLRLQGTLSGSDATESYSGDIERLLESLRKSQSYQLDRNHTHCGLRTRLVPMLDQVELYLIGGKVIDVGICGECWQANRHRCAWKDVKRPVAWRPAAIHTASGKARGVAGGEGCLAYHNKIRDMFTAVSRDWTSRDTDGVGTGIRFGAHTPFLKFE
ncbi:hypothetical protein E2P81_ATG10981 [Venturia nashicola]|uniref:Uncharacterized protein n=1 Tax=Venturia nashicola TaxID=86259 RepID=A0A4Z1NU08_9PEZI|nr:hypothetical protein E6O75_ATG10656 [Venturia nashicola]TLD27693.1 hypothetical protein E2P81_ATG10981 [Venturia nashicola]